jgi:hypothetical protein
MSKEITVPDILNKLSSIFTKDMYLIQSRYCIGGNETEDETAGKSICVLSPDIADIFVDYFGSSNVIYFENIKKAKSAYGTEDEYKFVKVKLEERNKKQLIDTKDSYMKIIDSVKGWERFNFNEEQIESILTDGNTITLFEGNSSVPEVTVSKTIFPLIKSKDFNNIFYNVSKARNLKNMYTLVLNYDHNTFQFYNIIYYIKESKNKTNLKSLEKQSNKTEE